MQGAGLSSFAPLALAWEDTADSLRLSQFSSGCQNARAGLKTGQYTVRKRNRSEDRPLQGFLFQTNCGNFCGWLA